MLSDIMALALSVLGILFILFSVIFRLMVWKEGKITIALPMFSQDREILNRIINIREICAFLGIHKKCTIVVINYGAPDWFCNELKEYFSNYDFLKIIDSGKTIKELHT